MKHEDFLKIRMFNKLIALLFPRASHLQIRTVRYAFPVVVASSLVFALASIIGTNQSYITISANTDTVSEGEVFYIDVKVNAHIPVNAIDVVLDYPTDEINVTSVDTGTSVITLWTEQPYAKDGKIYLRGGTFRKGFVGLHTVARIKAVGTKSGSAKFYVADSVLVAGDGKGTNVPVTEDDEENTFVIAINPVDGKIKDKRALVLISDLNGDGDVDMSDITSFMKSWFIKDKTYDLNGDGKMTFRDFSILLAQSFKQ